MTIRGRANVIDTCRISLRMLIIANAISEANCSRRDLYVNGIFSITMTVAVKYISVTRAHD